MNQECKSWYEVSYKSGGFDAQRRYPNEELMRFMGRRFFPIQRENRKGMRILETGCGSGANLWPIAREGFNAYGIDLSAEGVTLCEKMLESWGCTAVLHVGDMCNLPYEDQFFDGVVDVFSSYCLLEQAFDVYLKGVARVLKSTGKSGKGTFFSYAPSKNSDVFKKAVDAEKIDPNTLNGIRRPDAPFSGNFYPFRFISLEDYEVALTRAGLRMTYGETVGRSYGGGKGKNISNLLSYRRKRSD
jgi:ubiquinone/menaquinone biosynthesis C-methylase UbiE